MQPAVKVAVSVRTKDELYYTSSAVKRETGDTVAPSSSSSSRSIIIVTLGSRAGKVGHNHNSAQLEVEASTAGVRQIRNSALNRDSAVSSSQPVLAPVFTVISEQFKIWAAKVKEKKNNDFRVKGSR